MGLETAAIVGLGIAGVSAVHGREESRSSARAAKKSQEAKKKQITLQTRQETIELKRSQRQQLREERVRRAKVLVSSEAAGTAGSSSEATAISNLITRTESNIAVQKGAAKTARKITKIGKDVAGFQAKAAELQARSNLAFDVFSTALQFV